MPDYDAGGRDGPRVPGPHDVRPARTSAGEQPPYGDWRRWVPLVVMGLMGILLAATLFDGGTEAEQLSYSAFLDRVEAGRIAAVTIENESGTVTGTTTDDEAFRTTIPTDIAGDELTDTLRDEGVEITAEPPTDGGIAVLLANLLPLLLIVGVFWWFSRRARGQMGQLTKVGQSQAKVVEAERPQAGFDDVAGYDPVKREIQEAVDYLEDPSKYHRLGAEGPGGILLVGPPGTGKTMLARAVAAEAEVPFIAAAGSEFVEMLVGVGASRVRDLFKKARKLSPAIVFIDELDSVGRKRGSSSTIGSNNEQEQTLNQLLAEMDGFDPATGIVVIAATNRPEMLDPALLRPGRFDRRVEVPLPRIDDRVAILRVHTRGKPVTDDLDLRRIARGTPGFSGAELRNLVNEAAIQAVREDRDRITDADFDAARDRIILGQREESSVLLPEERHRVAVHEAGHAIVAALQDDADPVAKVTILPSGRALGVTEQLPLDERRLYPESWLRASLNVRLGGRVAELVALDEASSGAANDLATATQLAGRMVRDFGLSDEIGPIGYASAEEGGAGPSPLMNRPYAEETQRRVDVEIATLLRRAEQDARRMLTEHRDALDGLVERLLADETVDGEVVYGLVGRPVPRARADED